ncbi:RluA family pseudouridine synthase [Neobacillus mesonae]|uniref:RluA family pseudouridine synthase n=1 Tax=Neobacillus mesonae TaxID=1193713 RepID=UPI002040B43F|nr:RluA family pseudouridine synthase [Neobacillus mesonae]MCM3569976.1 RluA family pseudouridine synthase [Neobacillus mesonae]
MTSRFNLKWCIKEQNAGLQIKDFLKNEDISRTALTDIKFKGGSIRINGEDVNVRYVLQTGDELMVAFPPEIPSEGAKGEELPLTILFEDEFLLVVNKPPEMNTIPSREHPSGSLANALVGYYQRQGLGAAPHIVTRLDRNTSGIVLVAKHRHVHHLFSIMQRKRKVERTYEAFASGNIADSSGTITAPIGRKDSSIIEREVREDGQYACTHYHVLERFPSFTHVELNLGTGRTHQIRVHMAFIGHPLIGDDLYGGPINRKLNRQALHCKKLKFEHPFTGEEMCFTAPLPDDLFQLLEAD